MSHCKDLVRNPTLHNFTYLITYIMHWSSCHIAMHHLVSLQQFCKTLSTNDVKGTKNYPEGFLNQSQCPHLIRRLKIQHCSCQSFDVWLKVVSLKPLEAQHQWPIIFVLNIFYIYFSYFLSICMYLFILIYTTSQMFGIKNKVYSFMQS